MSTLHNSLATCDPDVVPLVSSRLRPFISRSAVDSSGRLGSFYDASCDQVLPQPILQCDTPLTSSRCPRSCYFESFNSDEAKSLLKWCKIHPELRLSVLLNMTRETGVGELLNYSHPIDKYTRFIFFSYTAHTDYIPDDGFNRLKDNRISMIDTTATHVIVLVQWGIDAVAVFQLPHNDESADVIDSVITKLCLSLSNNQNDIVMSKEDESFLRQENSVNVFSNIPELCKVK